MMTRGMPILTLSIVLASGSLVGCDRLQSDFAARTVELGERTAIQRYSGEVPQLDDLQKAWVVAFATARTHKSAREIGLAVKTGVVPGIQKYKAAMSLMPVHTAELRRIHSHMLVAHSTLIDGFSAFAEDLDDTNYEDRREALKAQVQQFHVAQLTYRTRLDSYYEAHGVELLPAAPLRM